MPGTAKLSAPIPFSMSDLLSAQARDSLKAPTYNIVMRYIKERLLLLIRSYCGIHKPSVQQKSADSRRATNGWLQCDAAALERRQKREIARTMRERNLYSRPVAETLGAIFPRPQNPRQGSSLSLSRSSPRSYFLLLTRCRKAPDGPRSDWQAGIWKRSLDSRDYDAVASRTSFAADRTSEMTSPMSESVVR